MAEKHSTESPDAVRKTRLFEFFSTAGSGPLLAVNAGVPLVDALEWARNFMVSARAIVHDAAMEKDSDEFWSAWYMTDLAEAILEALHQRAEDEEREEVSIKGVRNA